MATVSTVQHSVSIQQVVSIHPTRSTVLTIRDLILIRAVQQSKAVVHLGSLILSISIITTLGHTVRG